MKEVKNYYETFKKLRILDKEQREVYVKYRIPNAFTVNKPSYFYPSNLVVERDIYISFPVVIYSTSFDIEGNIFKKHFNKGSVVGWYIRDRDYPLETSDVEMDRVTNYIDSLFQENHPSFRKENTLFIKEAKKQGYHKIEYSIGIWTEDGVLDESTFSNDENLKKNLVSAFNHLLDKSLSIYNQSPDVIINQIKKIFANDLIVTDEQAKFANDFVDYIFDKNITEEDIRSNEKYSSVMNIMRDNHNFMMAINDRHNLVNTLFTLYKEDDLKGENINLDFINTLFFMNMLSKDSIVHEMKDTNGNIYTKEDVLKLKENFGFISVKHYRTEFLKNLLSQI